MDGDSEPTRRHLLRRWLWAIGLLVLAVLPVGFWSIRSSRAKWSLLPPRPVDWAMKPLSSAKIEERVLPYGRVELRIEHDPLVGVTPEMLVWWWRNIDGEMQLKGQTYRRYLIWHPIDHIHFQMLKRLADGSVGVGSVFHLVEAFGADMKHLVEAVFHLRRIDTAGAMVEMYALGQTVMSIRGSFLAQGTATKIITTMTIGFSGWAGALGVNGPLIGWFFPAERRRAWLKHSVEEIGNLQFFLPDLYRRHAGN